MNTERSECSECSECNLTSPLCIIDLLPLELIYRIDKLLHWSYQHIVNFDIIRKVEKLEDAQSMDPSLQYYHIHHKNNCIVPPFLFPESYKRTTYYWVYETLDNCEDRESKIYCNKRKIYDRGEMFYIKGEQYSSSIVNQRRVKLQKIKQ
jgi:hypothetical protein